MMQRLLFILFLLFLFMLEGTVMQWLVPDVWGANWTVVPAFSLVMVVLISFYFPGHQGIAYGSVLGLMHDLTFGHVIGAYLFSFTLAAYFTEQMAKQYRRHSVLVVVATLVALTMHLFVIYGLYSLFDITQMGWNWMVYRLLVPSLLFNVLFTIVLLRPLKRWLAKMGASVEE